MALTCPDGIVAYWKLDEESGTTFDDFVDNYDGSCSSTNCPAPISGIIDGGQNFDGNNDFIDAGDITELNGASAFTVIGWYNQTDLSVIAFLFSKLNDGSNDITAETFSNRLYIEIGNGGNAYAYWSGYSSTISANTWYHAAFVFDGSGATNADRIKLYINGVQRTLNFGGSSIPTTTANLASYNFQLSKTPYPWNGGMDEVAVFDRALNSSEISEYYNSGLGKNICEYVCGDGIIDPGEQCDDQNTENGDVTY